MKPASILTAVILALITPVAFAADWTLEPVAATGDLASFTGLGIGHDGTVYAGAFQSPGNVYQRTRDPVTGVWGTPTTLTGSFRTLATDNTGRPHMLYSDAVGAKLAILDDGGVWQVSSLPATGSTSLSIDFDSQNRPHIGYVDNPARTFRRLSWNGSGWDSEDILTHPNLLGSATIALDNNDQVHALWYSSIASALTHLNWTGSGYASRVVGGGYGDSMVFDADNNLHISFTTEFSTSRLRYGVFDGTDWTVSAFDTDRADEGSIALDADGNPHILYGVNRSAGAGNDTLRHAAWDGTQWNVTDIDSWNSTLNGPEDQVLRIVGNRAHILYTNDSKNLIYGTALIPEPASLLLLAIGGLAIARRR